jgi:phosphoribosyl-ATP pyrophosphohydrolase/phosphoribosyl-AMP cyclohydrolase
MSDIEFLAALERIVDERLAELSAAPPGEAASGSYTVRLASRGLPKVAQKVGEEGVETALAAVVEPAERVTEEAADLIYHLLVLLRMRGLRLADVASELERRHAARH